MKAVNNLTEEIRLIDPDILTQKIQKWDKMEFLNLLPFVKEHYWQNNASINVFRVVGTQHPDYIGLTWLDLLEQGKRMPLNLRLYKENPGYYYETVKKEPTMYFQSIDGGDLYIGADGNHRTCIAKAVFYLTGETTLHGVTVDDYRVDWRLKEFYDRLNTLITGEMLPYYIEPVTEIISRDDSGGWMLEKYKPTIKLYDIKQKNEHYLDAGGSESFLKQLEKPKDSLFAKLRRYFHVD